MKHTGQAGVRSPSCFIVGYHISENLVGQVAPQALPDAYETTKFLFRSDWPLFGAGGGLDADKRPVSMSHVPSKNRNKILRKSTR